MNDKFIILGVIKFVMYFKNDPREGINHMTEGSCTNKTTQHKIDQKTLLIMGKKKILLFIHVLTGDVKIELSAWVNPTCVE